MPLELRRKKDGSLKSKYWYGAYQVSGKRCVKNLGIEVTGTVPDSLKQDGDKKFERSRGKALEKLKQTVADARETKSSEGLVQKLHELKYGSEIQSFAISDLIAAWEVMPKKRRTLNPRYAKDVKTTLRRFLDWLSEHYPKVEDAAQVDRRIAREFMASEDDRGIADKTWNDSLKRLRATFKFLATEYGLWQNPFDGIRMREENHHHRKPLTEAQMASLLDKVKDDDFCRPLIISGLSTAMRLGDCCNLKWSDVDLDSPSPSITIKTSKTGETVCIPIYERLRVELVAARKLRRKKDEEYVWPEQAKLYGIEHTRVSRKLGPVFKKAVGDDAVHEERKHGILKASVIDFHSLRTTWITEALTRGIPIETVKRISGHKTVEVVTEHYFHPSKEQVRTALEGALPSMLTNGVAEDGKEEENPGLKALGEAAATLDKMHGKNWKKQRDAALTAVKAAQDWIEKNHAHA